MNDSVQRIGLFSVVDTSSDTALGLLRNCLVGALPYKYGVLDIIVPVVRS